MCFTGRPQLAGIKNCLSKPQSSLWVSDMSSESREDSPPGSRSAKSQALTAVLCHQEPVHLNRLCVQEAQCTQHVLNSFLAHLWPREVVALRTQLQGTVHRALSGRLGGPSRAAPLGLRKELFNCKVPRLQRGLREPKQVLLGYGHPTPLVCGQQMARE